AFAIEKCNVIPCCHVLNEALGRQSTLDSEQPLPDRQFGIRFPYADNSRGSGVVVKWGFDLPRPKDIAVLKLEKDVPPAAGVAVFSEADVQQTKWSFIGWDEKGIERESRGELVSVLANGDYQLKDLTGLFGGISRGYSGAAVWSEQLKSCFGMVVSNQRDQFDKDIIYAIPTSALRDIWPGLQTIRQ